MHLHSLKYIKSTHPLTKVPIFCFLPILLRTPPKPPPPPAGRFVPLDKPQLNEIETVMYSVHHNNNNNNNDNLKKSHWKAQFQIYLQSPHGVKNCVQHVMYVLVVPAQSCDVRSSGPSTIMCSTLHAYHVMYVLVVPAQSCAAHCMLIMWCTF